MTESQRITVCLSIDTEEDNWQPTRNHVSANNIRQLPKLHEFLTSFGARPTYFTAHSVVAEPWSAEIIASIHAGGSVEIGGHLHPWNTPPTDERFVPRNTMMRNLPPEVQRAKLSTLTGAIAAAVGNAPTSFRAGRWGLGLETLPLLMELGYQVDSSVMPFMNWESMDDGANFVGAPCDVYRLGGDDFRVPHPDGVLVEVPVSSGYSRRGFDFWHRVYERLHRQPLALLRLAGIASRTRLIRKIQLSPETDTPRDMLVLSERLIELGVEHLHMYWHSPSMTPGLSPYGETQRDVDQMYRRIGEYLEGLGRLVTVEFATVGELAASSSPVGAEVD
jgi:hypothetical protein